MSDFARRERNDEARSSGGNERRGESQAQRRPPPARGSTPPAASERRRSRQAERESESLFGGLFGGGDDDDDDGGGVLGFIRNTARSAERAVRNTVHAVQETATEVTETVRETVAQAAPVVREAYLHHAQEAREELLDVAEGVRDFTTEDLAPALGLADGPRHERPPERRLSGDRQRNVIDRAGQIFDAVDGVGTNVEQIRDALRGADEDTIAAIRSEYFRTYHQNLDTVLRTETSGADERQLTDLMTGNPVVQAEALLERATHGYFTDTDEVRRVFWDLDDHQRAELTQRMGADNLREMLERETTGVDEEVTIALSEGRTADAYAARIAENLDGGVLGFRDGVRSVQQLLGEHSMGTDEVNDILRNTPEDQREELMAAVERRTGSPMQELIDRTTGEGAEREELTLRAQGENGQADGIALERAANDSETGDILLNAALGVACPIYGIYYVADLAIDQVGRDNPGDFNPTDSERIHEILRRRPGEEDADFRTRIQAATATFEERSHGTLRRMLNEEMGDGSLDQQMATDLVDDGRVDPAITIAHAMHRHPGTDVQTLLGELRGPDGEGLSRDELRRIEREYPRIMRRAGLETDGLRGDMFGAYSEDGSGLAEVSGDEGFDIGELMRGAPADDLERIERRMRRIEHTRGSGLWNEGVDTVLGAVSDTPAVLEEQNRELERMRHQLVNHEELSEADRRHLAATLQRHDLAETSYRHRADEVGEAAQTAVEVVGAAVMTAATVASGGTLAPVEAAVLAAMWGTAGVAANVAFTGAGRTSQEEAGRYALDVAVDAASAGMGAGLGGHGEGLIEAGLGEGVNILTDGRRQGGADGLASLGRIGGALAAEGLDIGLSDRLERRLGGTFGGMITNSLGSVAETGADANTWEHGMDEGLGRLGTAAGRAALESGLESGAEHLAGRSAPARRHEERQRAAAERALEGTAPRPLGEGERHAGDDFRADVDDHEALRELVAETSSTEAVTARTEDLSPRDAAGQRTDQTRALMDMQQEHGVAPGQGMDPRVVERAGRQEAMVSSLEERAAEMNDDQRAYAQLAAELRARNAAEPGSVSRQEMDNLREMGDAVGLSQDELDAMPPEDRLLHQGFTPEQIAQHFTPRDLDADVAVDPGDDEMIGTNRDARGLPAEGDLNADAQTEVTAGPELAPTVRRPMTPAEAQLAVDINSVLADSFREGNQFGKLVPDTVMGDLQTGRGTGGSGDSARDFGPAGLRGDVGELLNTELTPERSDRPVTSLDQAQVTGLDYPTSVYVDDPRGPSARFNPGLTDADGPGLARVQGTITDEIANAAEVPVGRGVMRQAQSQAAALAAAQERSRAQGDAEPHIPTLLRTGGGGDNLPGLMERTRETQIDTRTGLGYSATERANMPVVPNQERTIGRTQALPDDASVVITRPDGSQSTALEMPAGGGGPMVPAASDAETRDRVDRERIAGEQRVSDAATNRAEAPARAEAERAARRGEDTDRYREHRWRRFGRRS